MFSNNPSYTLAYTTKDGTEFYTPAQGTDYHMSRYVAAQAQNIYSGSGMD